MGEARRVVLLNNKDIVFSVLQHLDDHKFRATMACVCKTWQACVRQSWDRVHICFNCVETLTARLDWLQDQLLDHKTLLKSLELHSSMPSPILVEVWQCLHCTEDPAIIAGLRMCARGPNHGTHAHQLWAQPGALWCPLPP